MANSLSKEKESSNDIEGGQKSAGEGISKSEALKQKREELRGKMDKLSEKKTEMIWLLKQVIKQDALRKMKKKKQETA